MSAVLLLARCFLALVFAVAATGKLAGPKGCHSFGSLGRRHR